MNRLAILTLALLLPAGWAAAQEPEPRVWVHAPAEDLLSLFPEKGAGFLITRAEYERLVELAKAAERTRAEQPPLDARVVRGVSQARIDGDTLRITSSYLVVVQAERPVAVPFGIEGLALEGIEISGPEDGPQALVGDTLHLPGPGMYDVIARFSARLAVKDGTKTAEFRLPASATQTLALEVPPQTEGEVGPIARAFDAGNERKVVTGYPDVNGLFRVWIRPRTEARRLDPLVGAEFGMRARVGEAGTQVMWQVDLEVLRAPIARTTLSVPKGLQIRGLTGKGVRTWRVVPDDAPGATRDTLEIAFVDPVLDRVQIRIEAEMARGEGDRVAIPMVQVPGAVRFRGGLLVDAEPEVRILGLEAEGVRRIDPRGKAMAGVAAAFEVWARDASVTVKAERVASTTRAASRTLLTLHEGGKSLRVVFTYDLRGKPLFRLEPRLPANWILRDLLLDGGAFEHRWEAEEGRLSLVFPEGLKPGTHVLALHLDTDEVDWVPNEDAARFALAGLRSGLEDESGVIVVESDEAFRVGVEASTGLEPVGLPVVEQQGLPVGERTLYAWRYDAPDWAARFRVERHLPQIGATVVEHVMPRERVLAIEADIRLRIERTGVRELAVSLPKGTGPLVDFVGDNIKERRAPAEGADPETWTIVFQRRVRGDYRLKVSFERSFETDQWSAAVPEIAVPAAQERGFVVVYAPSTTAIAVERNGLREADLGELPDTPERAPLEVLAYAAHPFTVTLSSQRHEPHDVVQAVALEAHIYGVFTPDGKLRCRAEYRVRNNDQAFLGFGLPEGSRLLAALVDGEPVKPLVEQGVGKLPLVRSANRIAPFLVSIVYESDVDAVEGRGSIRVARPTLDIDVLKTSYRLHLPGDYELLDADGTLVPVDEPRRETLLEALEPLLEVPLFVKGQTAWGAEDAGPPASGPRRNTEHGGKEVTRSLAVDAARAPGAAEAEPAARDERKSRERSKDKRAAEELQLKGEAEAMEDHNEIDTDDEYEEAMDFEESAGEEGLTDAPFEGPVPETTLGVGGGSGGRFAGRGRRQVAQGEDRAARPTTPPAPKPAGLERVRPERALLSLDLQFLRSGNVVELESLAPDGSVELILATGETFTRRRLLGGILGVFAGLMLFLQGRPALWRVLPGAVLLVVGLELAGVSFLPTDFTVGAGLGLLAVFALAVLLRVPRVLRPIGRLLSRIRLPRFSRGGAGLVVLAALAARAQAQEPDTVLVPYRDDPEKIERVFLPADTYHRLRALAYPHEASRATAVETASYEATLAGEQLAVVARYVIRKETAEAERIPLALDGVAVVEAALNGEPAQLAVENEGYFLLLSGAGRHELVLALRPRLEQRGEQAWFQVRVRPVANATLTLNDDRSNVERNVVGLGGHEGNVWRLGPVGAIGALWTRKTEGYKAAEAELRADTETVISVRDAFTAVAARIRFGVAGGTVDRFRVRVGDDLVVRSVACEGLAGWEVTDQGVLVVALDKPVDDARVVTIVGERPAQRERTEALPLVEPLDVLRDAGVLAIDTLPDLKITIGQTQGLLRARSEDAPQGLSAASDSRAAVQSVHRYAVRPFRLEWTVALEPTRLRAETTVDVLLDREKAWAVALVAAEVERGPGVFGLEVELPADWEVEQVQGRLREWWVDGGVLHLARSSRQTGSDRYRIVLRRRGATGDDFQAPALRVRDAVRESGLVRLRAADGLELVASDPVNLIPEDVARAGGGAWGPAVRAYRFAQAPWSLTLATREETREVEALVVTRVVPLADSLRVEALVNFHVRRGLVDRIAFTVPVAEEGDALIRAPDLREERSEAVEGGRLFTLMLRTPTRGSASAAVTYHLPYDAAVRGVEPVDASRVERYVAVERVPDGMVKTENTDNLEAGGFDDLPLAPAESTPQSVARVFVGSGGPWSLDVRVQRHTFEGVASAVIYRAKAEAVVDRTGWTRVQVAYRVQNRSEQFLKLALPHGAELYSVFVAGEGVRPLTEEGWLLIPLRKLAVGSPSYEVEVVYAYAGPEVGGKDFDVDVPRVDRLEVRRTTLSLFLPKGFSYDFDEYMEEIEEADLYQREFQDRYEELKELSAVAERGSVLQAQRAASNSLQLGQELELYYDRVQATTKSGQQLQTMRSQLGAAEQLQGANEQVLRQSVQVVAPEQDGAQVEESTVTQWRVNRGYVRGKKADELDALEKFAEKNLRQDLEGNDVQMGEPMQTETATGGAYQGPSGAVPAGVREPGDLPPPSDPGAPAASPQPQAEAQGMFFGLFAGDEDAGEGGGPENLRRELRRRQANGEPPASGGIAAGTRFEVADSLQDEKAPSFDARPELGRLLKEQQEAKLFAPEEMARARGRISIRIDLPREGETYHFARLGSEGTVEVDSDRSRPGLWKGLIAIICALAAWIFLRGRP